MTTPPKRKKAPPKKTAALKPPSKGKPRGKTGGKSPRKKAPKKVKGKTAGKAGSKSSYTVEQGNAICELIAEGKTLRETCRELKTDRVKIYRWFATFPAFRNQYTRARRIGADANFDELIELAKGEGDDSPASVNRARLIVDTQKWRLAKMVPRKYGDKQEITHKGSVASGPPMGDRDGLYQGLAERVRGELVKEN